MKTRNLTTTLLAFAALTLLSVGAQASTVINLFTGGPDTDIHCQNNPGVSDPAPNCWTSSTSSGNPRHYKVTSAGTDEILSAFRFGVERDDANGIGIGDVRAAIPGFVDLTELYKADSFEVKNAVPPPLRPLPDEESGILIDSYSTSFVFDSLDLDDGYTGATITYNGGPSVDCSSDCYLLVKDGDNSPAAYLFDLALSGWDGSMDLVLENFWGGTNGSISHVAIYGNVSPIPVPAAFWLFGTALLGFIGVSRSTRV